MVEQIPRRGIRIQVASAIGVGGDAFDPRRPWATGSCNTETSSVATYRAMKLLVTSWRAKAARVRAEGGCANRPSPGAVLAQFSEA